MEEYEKKDVIPMTEECINLHDILAQNTSVSSAYVKQEPWADPSNDCPPDFQDVLDQLVHSDGADSKAGTSKASFFCVLCQSRVPTTVSQLIIPSQPKLRSAVWQLLLKSRKYSSSAVEKAMCSSGTIVICRRHVEEGNPAAKFFCALCRQHAPVTVPHIVVTPDSVYKELTRDQLLRRYSKWKVEYSLEGSMTKYICKHHLERDNWDRKEPTIFCSLCGNTQILKRHTAIIPSCPELQMKLRERIVEAPLSPDHIEEMFTLAKENGSKSKPLRMCRDHLTGVDDVEPIVVVDNPRKPEDKPNKLTPVDMIALRAKRKAEAAERKRVLKAEWRLEYNAERRRKTAEKKKLRIERAKAAELNGEVAPVKKPRKPRTVVKKSEEERRVMIAERKLREKLRQVERKANETAEQTAELKRKAKERLQRRRKDSEKWAETCRRINEKRKLTRKPETAQQKEIRSERDRVRRERKKRGRAEREESGGGGRENEENGESAEKTYSPKKVKKMLAEVECVEEQTESY